MRTIYSIILLVCVTLIFIVVKQTFVNAISITTMSKTEFHIKRNISSISLLFKTTSSLCISFTSYELLNGLMELFKSDYRSIVFYEFKKPIPTCIGGFILETNNYTVQECEGIIDSSQTTEVYLIKGSITAALQSSLEACLSVAQTPEVLALSLSDSELLQLSPVFPQPRHFVRTSVTQVLERRVDNSKKLDLQGSALTVGTMYYIPFLFYGKSNSTREDEPDGLYVKLLKEMERQLNFTHKYLLHAGYGTALNNGTWSKDGLGHDIQEGRVDIVAVNVWQVPDFYKLMDFGPALNKDKLAFLVMRPEMIDFQWQEILRIFKHKVWFAIFGSFVLTVMVYWAGVNWGSRPCTESWSGCILTLFGYFTSSTSHSRVDEGNTRFSLTSWSVFSLLITSCLSTGIVTRLTIPLYSPRLNTIEQLVQGKYFWTVQFYARFKNSPSLRESMFDFKNHWIQLFETRYVYMDEEEVRRTLGTDKKMTFVVETYGHDFVSLETDGLDDHKNLKKYRVSAESFAEGFVSFGVKKRSFLLEPLNQFTLLVLQAGLMAHWKDEVIRRWPQYDTRHLLIEQDIPTFREPQGLPLYKVQPAFFLLLLGLGLAFFVLFIEFCW